MRAKDFNVPRKLCFCIGLLVVFLGVQAQKIEKITVIPATYKIEAANRGAVDSGLYNMLLPYGDSIKKTMNRVIGFSANGMTKKQPESGLGNFLSDCMRLMGQKKFGVSIDAAFVNYGGIRTYLPKGEVTTGKVYEIMPFDNLVVLQKVKGDSLLSFLNRVAEKGGWPLSGITMQISNKKAVNVLIDNQPLDAEKYYTIANSDYIANGGDDCFMLKPFAIQNKGYLFRDAIIEYITELTEQGKSIDVNVQNRITYAK